MHHSYFPVTLRDLRSRIHFSEIEEGFLRIGDVLVETQYLNHTAPTVGFRISSGGATVAYVTDHEPYWNPSGSVFGHPGDQRHIEFIEGADLVIHDAQYSAQEYPSKIGWGHSTIDYATEVAMVAGARRVALFHHEPVHDDAEIERLERTAKELVKVRRSSTEVFAAAEGMEISVCGDRTAAPRRKRHAVLRRPMGGERILIVSASEPDVAAIRQVLVEDELVVMSAPNVRTALSRAAEISVDLVIIDDRLPDGEGMALVGPIREAAGLPHVPVLLLTEQALGASAQPRSTDAVTDYLAKPFSPPMLRARVSAWLTRTSRQAAPSAAGRDRDEPVRSLPAPEMPSAIAVKRVARGSYASLLAAIPVFQSLSQEHLDRLEACAVEHVFVPGHVLIRQGETAEHVYAILSGQVRIVEMTSEAPLLERFVGELGQGEIVGEMGLLLDRFRTASVVAVERTRCLVFPQRDFAAILQTSSGLAVALLRVMAERLYNVNHLLARSGPDPLTALAGRRSFLDQYRRLAAGARRRCSSVILLLIDVLQLRTINDQFGYAVGDEVLRAVADALVISTRTTDLLARYGGDEFAVLLVDAGMEQVEVITGRVREKLDDLARRRALPSAVRCAIGVAVSQVPPETADELLRDADLDMRRRNTS
jgi:diguanylate cyclase (GGDEF)-like protein